MAKRPRLRKQPSNSTKKLTRRAFVTNRKSELMSACEAAGLDWRSLTITLPQGDEGLMTAALATLLGYHLQHAFDPRWSVDELERNKMALAAERKKSEELARKLREP